MMNHSITLSNEKETEGFTSINIIDLTKSKDKDSELPLIDELNRILHENTADSNFYPTSDNAFTLPTDEELYDQDFNELFNLDSQPQESQHQKTQPQAPQYQTQSTQFNLSNPLDETLITFRNALNNKKPDEIISLLKNNSDFLNYIIGSTSHIYTFEELNELLSCFYLSLESGHHLLRETCWQNPTLRDCVTGQAIQTPTGPTSLPLSGSKKFFIYALVVQAQSIAETIWYNTPGFKDYITGKTAIYFHDSHQSYALTVPEQNQILLHTLFTAQSQHDYDRARDHINCFDNIPQLIDVRNEFIARQPRTIRSLNFPQALIDLLDKRIIDLIKLIKMQYRIQETIPNAQMVNNTFFENDEVILSGQISGDGIIANGSTEQETHAPSEITAAIDTQQIHGMPISQAENNNPSFNTAALNAFKNYCKNGNNFITTSTQPTTNSEVQKMDDFPDSSKRRKPNH